MTDEDTIHEDELSPEDLESAKAGDAAGKGDKRGHWLHVNINLDVDVAQILFALIGVPVVGAVLLAWLAS